MKGLFENPSYAASLLSKYDRLKSIRHDVKLGNLSGFPEPTELDILDDNMEEIDNQLDHALGKIETLVEELAKGKQ